MPRNHLVDFCQTAITIQQMDVMYIKQINCLILLLKLLFPKHRLDL